MALFFLVARLPWPVGRRIVQRQVERLIPVAQNEVTRSTGQNVGQIADRTRRSFTVHRHQPSLIILVAEIRSGSTNRAKVFVKARLQGSEIWRFSAVPLSKQSCSITRLREESGQGWKFRLQAKRVSVDPRQYRLCQTSGMAGRITAGQMRNARRRAGGRARIAIRQAHAFGGQSVNSWRQIVRASVTTWIRPTHIVGKNENDVGLIHVKAHNL